MLVLLLPGVSSRVSGFPVASPCLWGKLQKNCLFVMMPTLKIARSLVRNARFGAPTCLVSRLWFSCGFAVSMWEAAKPLLFEGFQGSCHVVLRGVAGVALCDIPTCLIMCQKCQNWRKSRTKCWFFCIHVSCLESLVFLWRRRVYGGSCKTSPFRRFPSRLSCRFAWQA